MEQQTFGKKKGGILQLFYALCWLRLIGGVLSCLLRLLQFFFLIATPTGIFMMFPLLFSFYYCLLQWKLIVTLERRQPPSIGLLWLCALTLWGNALTLLLVTLDVRTAVIQCLSAVLSAVIWSCYFRYSKRCDVYFDEQPKSYLEASYYTIRDWTFGTMERRSLMKCDPAPFFAGLTALAMPGSPFETQRLLAYLDREYEPRFSMRWQLHPAAVKQHLQEINRELLALDPSQDPAEHTARWILEKTWAPISAQDLKDELLQGKTALDRIFCSPLWRPAIARIGPDCPRCKRHLMEGSPICPYCGAPVPDPYAHPAPGASAQ